MTRVPGSSNTGAPRRAAAAATRIPSAPLRCAGSRHPAFVHRASREWRRTLPSPAVLRRTAPRVRGRGWTDPRVRRRSRWDRPRTGRTARRRCRSARRWRSVPRSMWVIRTSQRTTTRSSRRRIRQISACLRSWGLSSLVAEGSGRGGWHQLNRIRSTPTSRS